jgi:hypothetical protein
VLTDAALAARLGEAARATIEQRFDRRKSAARLIELFREAVGGAAMERDPPSRGSRRARPRER